MIIILFNSNNYSNVDWCIGLTDVPVNCFYALDELSRIFEWRSDINAASPKKNPSMFCSLFWLILIIMGMALYWILIIPILCRMQIIGQNPGMWWRKYNKLVFARCEWEALEWPAYLNILLDNTNQLEFEYWWHSDIYFCWKNYSVPDSRPHATCAL